MTKATIAACSISALLALSARADEEPKVEAQPLHVGALQEFGYVVDGLYNAGTENAVPVHMDWVDHFGAFLTKEVTVEDRLHLSAGLGGVFEFRKPETVGLGFAFHQRKGFFIGPTKAMADYHFGDPADPYLTLGAGMFMYKYNGDANNLGEYLYRSLPYPTVTSTGGYVMINSAAANLQGLKSSLHMGNFKADFLLTTETGLAPLYDWSLGAIASYSIADGLLDLGAGVNFKRLIPVKPSRTVPEEETNGYFNYKGKDYTTNLNYYTYQIEYYNKKKTAADSAKAAVIKTLKDTASVLLDPVATPAGPKIEHYSNSGILAMARASFDMKKLFDTDIFGPQDLKFYTEAALLGVQNYPVFYEKRSERIPVMVGFNLPGFRFFDLISVQVEQMKSPWLNNTAQVGNEAIPLPFLPSASDTVASKKEWNDLATKDDFKWSFIMQKKLGNYITWSAQAASDHLRVVSARYFYGPQFDHNEVTISKDHWWLMTQISWGI